MLDVVLREGRTFCVSIPETASSAPPLPLWLSRCDSSQGREMLPRLLGASF